MNDASIDWIRIAFKVGIASVIFVLVLALLDSAFLVLDGPYSLMDRSPVVEDIGKAGLTMFTVCTFILWLKSWVLR